MQVSLICICTNLADNDLVQIVLPALIHQLGLTREQQLSPSNQLSLCLATQLELSQVDLPKKNALPQ